MGQGFKQLVAELVDAFGELAGQLFIGRSQRQFGRDVISTTIHAIAKASAITAARSIDAIAGDAGSADAPASASVASTNRSTRP